MEVERDNLLFDGLVEASHVSKYTSANEGKYALDENSAIEGQHLVMLRDKKELSPSRDEVKEVLRLYHKVLNELLKKNRKALMQKPNIHLVAASILRDRHTWLNTVKRLGSIPGVEVGDEFQYRAELCIIGLHHQIEKGIDYMEKDGMKLATSIVSSGRYPNVMNSLMDAQILKIVHAKNGKVLPYDHNERLIVRKLRIFECGPSCKCYGSRINRVTQRGI